MGGRLGELLGQGSSRRLFISWIGSSFRLTLSLYHHSSLSNPFILFVFDLLFGSNLLPDARWSAVCCLKWDVHPSSPTCSSRSASFAYSSYQGTAQSRLIDWHRSSILGSWQDLSEDRVRFAPNP